MNPLLLEILAQVDDLGICSTNHGIDEAGRRDPVRLRTLAAELPQRRRSDREWEPPAAIPQFLVAKAVTELTLRDRALRPDRPFSRLRSAFWSASGKVRPMAIASPTLRIEVPRRVGGAGELGEVEAGDLDDHIVEGGLEGGRSGTGDVVGDLVEGVSDREKRGDLGDRKAGCLRGQGRRT